MEELGFVSVIFLFSLSGHVKLGSYNLIGLLKIHNRSVFVIYHFLFIVHRHFFYRL